MKAKFTKEGSERCGVPENTIVEFEEINHFGCAVNATIIQTENKNQLGRVFSYLSIDGKGMYGDVGTIQLI